jgi:hypothetical protein
MTKLSIEKTLKSKIKANFVIIYTIMLHYEKIPYKTIILCYRIKV